MNADAQDLMRESIVWEKSPDPEHPFVAQHNGRKCLLRLNDFPADHLYTLIVDGEEIVDFDDWPKQWVQIQRQPAAAD